MAYLAEKLLIEPTLSKSDTLTDLIVRYWKRITAGRELYMLSWDAIG